MAIVLLAAVIAGALTHREIEVGMGEPMLRFAFLGLADDVRATRDFLDDLAERIASYLELLEQARTQLAAKGAGFHPRQALDGGIQTYLPTSARRGQHGDSSSRKASPRKRLRRAGNPLTREVGMNTTDVVNGEKRGTSTAIGPGRCPWTTHSGRAFARIRPARRVCQASGWRGWLGLRSDRVDRLRRERTNDSSRPPTPGGRRARR